jgi:hypothetical protein
MEFAKEAASSPAAADDDTFSEARVSVFATSTPDVESGCDLRVTAARALSDSS